MNRDEWKAVRDTKLANWDSRITAEQLAVVEKCLRAGDDICVLDQAPTPNTISSLRRRGFAPESSCHTETDRFGTEDGYYWLIEFK
jgi:hypothetical protein